MRGRRIKTLSALCTAAMDRRSVIFNGRRMPAAFVQNMQGVRIQRIIEDGLYLWKTESNPPWKRAQTEWIERIPFTLIPAYSAVKFGDGFISYQSDQEGEEWPRSSWNQQLSNDLNITHYKP